MSCCDYGKCCQGKDCPVRAGLVVPKEFISDPNPMLTLVSDLAVGFVLAFVLVLAAVLAVAVVIWAGVLR